MPMLGLLWVCLPAPLPVRAAGPTTAAAQTRPRLATSDRPHDVAPALWAMLQRLDARLTQIHDMQARFDKLKHTPLLRRPLVVHGQVWVKGDVARWDTQAPYVGTTLIRHGQVELYEPDEKRLEIYDLGQRMDLFGASPVPSFARMVRQFRVVQRPVKDLFSDLSPDEQRAATAGKLLALQWTPRDPEVARHLAHLDMLLEVAHARLERLRLEPAQDQSWTEYRFHDLKVNRGIDDAVFKLNLPADVKIEHPLKGMTP